MHQSRSNFLKKTRHEILRVMKQMKHKITDFDIQSQSGARDARDSPSTPPSCNPAYKIEHSDEHDGMANSWIYIYVYIDILIWD